MLHKLFPILALLAIAIPAFAQTTQPSGPATPMPPAPLRPSNEPPRKPGVPTLWLVGDSTVHVGTKGQLGWGEPFKAMFDPEKVRVINRAIGGRSSRTFVTEGRWDTILKDGQRGDFVIIQLGHNDGGPLAGDNRERGSIRGTGDETKDVTLTLGDNAGKAYTAHTYGWYIKKMVTDAQAAGITPIVCSWVPHGPSTTKPFTYDPDPKPESYRLWAQQTAEQTHAAYIDLYAIVWKTYADKTPEQIKKEFFTAEEPSNTHSSPAGAKNNAESVVAGLKQHPELPLAGFLKKDQ